MSNECQDQIVIDEVLRELLEYVTGRDATLDLELSGRSGTRGHASECCQQENVSTDS